MAEKVYKLSLEQLNDIVSDAVTNAIKNGVSSEIASLGFSSAQLPQRYSFTLQ